MLCSKHRQTFLLLIFVLFLFSEITSAQHHKGTEHDEEGESDYANHLIDQQRAWEDADRSRKLSARRQRAAVHDAHLDASLHAADVQGAREYHRRPVILALLSDDVAWLLLWLIPVSVLLWLMCRHRVKGVVGIHS
eukprot:PhM_4_TR11750/c0_g1_i1/m.22032